MYTATIAKKCFLILLMCIYLCEYLANKYAENEKHMIWKI